MFEFFLRLARCSSGAALAEATVIVPITLSLMVGGVDFGLALSTQATGSKSIRAAARYLATVPRSAVCGWGLAKAQNLAVYGTVNPQPGDLPLIPGWDPAGGADNYVNLGADTNCANPDVIQLTAKFPYQSIMLSAILPNTATLTLSAQHEERQIGD